MQLYIKQSVKYVRGVLLSAKVIACAFIFQIDIYILLKK